MVDRETGESVEMPEKKYKFKTSPQGSTLSPTLWRLYDAIFTKIYKDNLNEIQGDADMGPFMDSYEHVSYADDHVTVCVLSLPDNMDATMVSRFTTEAVKMCRDLLSSATNSVGCSINPENQRYYCRRNGGIRR